ncbi:MAG: nuclear transport factor 2 family protein [Chitinophagales bacterium]|nr:nuclear transport factor 2 family protein [Chitinophagales bacterium]
MRFLFLLLISGTLYAQDPVAPVQAQLDAYNKRDIEAFLKPYSDSVAVYFFPNRLLYKGKETMRKEYADMFTNTPDLHCTLKSRMILGNTIIDEESVIFNKNSPPLHAAAIYKVEKGLIVAVYFVGE